MIPHITTVKRPVGQLTRGKTARNRLRRVDNFVMQYDPFLLRRGDDALFVDVGFGAEPITTLESAVRFRRLNPSLRVLGVEIDRERVTALAPSPMHTPIFGWAVSTSPCAPQKRCG